MADPEGTAQQDGLGASAAFGGEREIGGYTCSRWRGVEWAAFEEYVRDQREAQAAKSFAKVEGITPVQRGDMLAQRREAPVSYADCHQALMTPSGFRYAMLLAFRVKNPGITQATLNEIEIEAGGTYALVSWMLGLDGLPDTGSGPRPESDSPPTGGEAGSA